MLVRKACSDNSVSYPLCSPLSLTGPPGTLPFPLLLIQVLYYEVNVCLLVQPVRSLPVRVHVLFIWDLPPQQPRTALIMGASQTAANWVHRQFNPTRSRTLSSRTVPHFALISVSCYCFMSALVSSFFNLILYFHLLLLYYSQGVSLSLPILSYPYREALGGFSSDWHSVSPSEIVQQKCVEWKNEWVDEWFKEWRDSFLHLYLLNFLVLQAGTLTVMFNSLFSLHFPNQTSPKILLSLAF